MPPCTGARGQPDLMVLDLGLPGLDGLDVTRAVRRDSAMPIIMLTARGDEADRIVGLELGADDYMAKPFSPQRARGPGARRAAPRRGHAADRPTSCAPPTSTSTCPPCA